MNFSKNRLAKNEYGDILLSLFLLTVIRQYLWFISDNVLSWILAFVVAASLFFLHLNFKERVDFKVDSNKYAFLLVLILPISVIYLMRVLLPDMSYDVLNYHITVGERALNGYPYIGGDYFPSGVVNPPPSADIFLGLFRSILGYRLGTFGNYLIFIWTAVIIDRFLKQFIYEHWKRYMFVLLVLSCEHSFFEINNYMVDMLAIPILLEATWVMVAFRDYKNKNYYLVYFSLLLGLSMALKITNLAFIIPLILWACRKTREVSYKAIVISCFVFFLPILPHAIYMFMQTGNPLFPFYNKIFRSIYWPIENFRDIRWGPQNVLQVMLWPLIILLNPERLSELNVYSGRITLTLVIILVAVFRFDKKQRELVIIWTAGLILWVLTSGYIRYGLYLEILGGLLITFSVFVRALPHKILKGSFLSLLIIQSIVSFGYTYFLEWSSRPNIFQNPRLHVGNVKYLLNDYSLNDFLLFDDKELIKRADVWVVAGPVVRGIESLLKNDIPIIDIADRRFLSNHKAAEKFTYITGGLPHKKIVAICNVEKLKSCLENIENRGFVTNRMDDITFPYFGNNITHTYALDISLRQAGEMERQEEPTVFKQSAIGEALPVNAFRGNISLKSPLEMMDVGSSGILKVQVRNDSGVLWPAKGRNDGQYRISLSYHWLDGNKGGVVVWDGNRTYLPYDLGPNEAVLLNATVDAPQKHGEYILEFDIVQEGICWFSAKGFTSTKTSVLVK